MKTNEIMKKASSLFHRTGFKIQQSSPEILIIGGIIGVIGSAVMACKATTKISEIQDKANEQLAAAEEALEKHADIYSEEDYKKDKLIIRVHQAVDYAKLYGPSIICGALSISCIVGSHVILKKRNLALSAAYATIDKAFKEYRGRVAEKYGDDIEKELRYNVKKLVTEEKVKTEEGKTKKIKDTVSYLDGDYSDYARIFDESNPNFERNPEINRAFLRTHQQFATDKLRAQGYLFLNDVYRDLGFKPTQAGQVIGWIYDPKSNDSDCYVDFGIFESKRPKAKDFVNGYEYAAVLDFNVDGPILDRFVKEVL